MRGFRLVATLAMCLAGAHAPAQAPWTAARLANGQPDLQGTWENNSATPLERPAQLAGTPLLSEEEVAAMQARAAQLFDAEADATFGDAIYLSVLDGNRPRSVFPTGTYSQNWVPPRYFERRTSLIEDPADGRLPPLTSQAVQRRAANAAAQSPRPRTFRSPTAASRLECPTSSPRT